MIGSSYFTQNYATDFQAIEAAAQNLKWSYGDQKYIGYTYVCNRTTSPGSPADPYIEQVVNVAIQGGTMFMLTGKMTETVDGTQYDTPCLILTGDAPADGLDAAFIAAANKLASMLGYFMHDGTTPAWCVSKGARILDPAADDPTRESFLECRRIKLTPDGVTSQSVYAQRFSYLIFLDVPSTANHTIYQPDIDNTLVYQVSQYNVGYRWNADLRRGVFFLTEMAYEVDLENMTDIIRALVSQYANPAETTQLTPRVEALETAVSELTGTGSGSVSSMIAAEAETRGAADAAMAAVIDQIPTFGSKVRTLVEAANNLNQYIPRM